jgi:protein-S-isoprenylcysteine O-methyltransferase Ste14
MFKFLALFACHGDPRGAILARRKFIISFVVFLLYSLFLTYQLSVWFAIPLIIVGIAYIVLIIFLVIESFRWGYLGDLIDKYFKKNIQQD